MAEHASEKHPMHEHYETGLSDGSEAVVDEEHASPVREKSSELKQAQVAAFAAERITHDPDMWHVFDNIVQIADTDPATVQRTLDEDEYIYPDPLFVAPRSRISAGTERTVATKEDYASYLREVGGRRHEAIARRAELLDEYRVFEPLVASLREDIQRYPSRAEHPSFLGSGGSADAFSLHTDEGEYVVRVPKGKGMNELAVDHHLVPGVRVKGLPHLEQMVAASYESGVTISQRMPGQMITNVKAEELNHITDEQLHDLIGTIASAGRAGVYVDTNPTNILYDAKQGFGIIDLSTNSETPQKAADAASGLAMSLSNAGIYGVEASTLDNLRYLCAQYAAHIPLLERYKTICSERFSGRDLHKITKRVDEIIDNTKVFIARCEKDLAAGEIDAMRHYRAADNLHELN